MKTLYSAKSLEIYRTNTNTEQTKKISLNNYLMNIAESRKKNIRYARSLHIHWAGKLICIIRST